MSIPVQPFDVAGLRDALPVAGLVRPAQSNVAWAADFLDRQPVVTHTHTPTRVEMEMEQDRVPNRTSSMGGLYGGSLGTRVLGACIAHSRTFHCRLLTC